MQLKDVWYAIADFFQWTFGLLEAAQNGPNFLFIAIGSILLIYWLTQMKAQASRGEK